MRVYPQMPTVELNSLIRKVGRNTARTLTELMFNKEFAKTLDDVPVGGPGLTALQHAHAKGQGGVIVSAHFGQWEAIRHVLKAQGIEVGAVYRPNNNPYYEPLFVKNVEEGGRPLVPKGTAGTKAMIRHLRKGGFMAILADQKYWAGQELDFMGHGALTSIAPAELALKYDLVLVPAYATRTSAGGINIDFEAPIALSDAVQMTQAINDSISARIHAHPDQWHWLHQRWETPDR